MEKEFKTIDEQIGILKSKKLNIQDYNNAYKILSKNNYYYIINGYKSLFLDEKSEREIYKRNTKLEEIYALYEFDKNIKIIFLKYILLIESEVDTYIAYEFSKIYGHKNYLVPENFNNIFQKSIIEKFINDINIEIEYQYRNSNRMITHYLDKYKYIPLWVLIRVLSFGKVSKFYSLMKTKEQNIISRKYNLRIDEFKIMLHNLTLIRNICAHDEKLYDIKMKNRIPSNKYHKILKIKNKNGNYIMATRDLFSIVIIMKLMLEDKYFKEFYINILKNIEELKNTISTISISKVLGSMGFPDNYKHLLIL